MYGCDLQHPGVFQKIVSNVCKILTDIDFNVVVFRGFSGAVIGPTVAMKLNKRWALIRKSTDKTHSWKTIEGKIWGNYVIIDDFINTGVTINSIIEQVKALNGNFPTCVGVVLYEPEWKPENRDFFKQLITVPILNWSNNDSSNAKKPN